MHNILSVQGKFSNQNSFKPAFRLELHPLRMTYLLSWVNILSCRALHREEEIERERESEGKRVRVREKECER